MKIGKITLDGYMNYGNVLQNYALNRVLEKYGYVDTLWHSTDNFLPRIWNRWYCKDIVKFLFDVHKFRSKIFSPYLGMEIVRQGKIKDWCDRFINIRKVSLDDQSITDEYDCFVVGSDQVWNPANNDLLETFLTFAEPKKRIAYAASISSPYVPKEQKSFYNKCILEMKHISMRETKGADLVRDISGREVPVLVDPTLLLTIDDWHEVSRMPAWYHGDEYILTYFLGDRPKSIKSLEDKLGVKVVNLLDVNEYEHYVTGPDEFIWAIEHAKLLYTDSFHGAVFSILFRTPFVVCNRIGDAVTENMGSRIDTLLNFFALGARRGTKENDYTIENPLIEPDWSQVDEVLARERKRSDEFLRQALKMDEVQDL